MDIGISHSKGSPVMPLDFGKLAATISLASEALAAAAEALAEAAGAMSAASSTFNSPKDISKSPIIVNSAASTPESLTSEKDETITGESKDSPSQVAQHTSVASQTTYRFDRGISATSGPPPMPPIASPSGEKELPPVQSSSGARTSYPFPQSVPKVISSFTDATLERETNNKHTDDGRHPSPVVPIPDSQPQMALTQASEKSRAHPELDALQLLEVMRSYPSFPPGKNYIHLDQPSDALAFIAYMALQARRVVCMVPTSLPNAHVQILKSLTHANVYYVNGSCDYTNYLTTRTKTDLTSYDILLTPCTNYLSNYRWMQESCPDCILHWTRPANVYSVTTRQVVDCLRGTFRACVMVVGEKSFDKDLHGVAPYPKAILERCSQTGSPLQLLRNIASQLLSETPVNPAPPRSLIPPPPPPLLQPPTSQANVVPLRPGNYYVILDQASDVDIIPVIAYIALNTKKVICYTTEDVNRYHSLIKSIADLNTIVSPSKGKKLKGAFSRLKSEKSGVLLRNNIGSEWNLFWTKSLADAAIYCGVPSDLQYCK
ncbi:hypothetical protein RSOLAG1IB_02024 [Rhizoctonia solani AG-1 IB]|uniref:Uncharacterized protein n=1 Tax=Thanatephorus cucumeris (strain AG1-IB / isolate 7/3/14) TaxID=1108050 RepID=A0A0B7FEH0_THACB|nr:hypothetical protein RSOLAG1IB_02024 [Rhizoctonia solani AG-1 IB]